MQQYYRKRIGLDSLVVHPYIGKLREPALGILNEWEVVVGHIGSVYDLTDFQSFLIATRRWALLKQKKFRLVLIGFSQQRLQALTAIPACEIRCIPNMPEAEAVKLLQTCDFVYAMYPFKESARVFRQTSLPTKLSTYIRAQRPIFAHTPADSSLAALVGKYELGVVASSLGDSELFQSLDAMDNPIPRKMFEITRREVYGWSNVESLRECLLNL
jgi:hypothetical protein